MAIAAPPSSSELGYDLVDWRALPADASAEALSGFMEKHPSSPLAELAWERLLQQHPQAKPPRHARKIARSYQHHQAALARTRVAQTVARLTPADTPTPRPAPKSLD